MKKDLSQKFIHVKGAKEHNLKNVEVKVPKHKLVVFTGVSGSGKSSLAFDTIYAEGQRRYVESLSSYARQFLGMIEKPQFEMIRGLSPTIAIEQKSASKNPRSTVGTITEIFDYLRVLYARLGVQHCTECGKVVGGGEASTMVSKIVNDFKASKIILLAPLVSNRKGEHKDCIQGLKAQGFSRVRIDGIIQNVEDVGALSKNKKHTIEAVVDRLQVKQTKDFEARLTDSVETTLKLGKGFMIVHELDGRELVLSEHRTCCGLSYPTLEPSSFSFNSPLGMCGKCQGLGSIMSIDKDRLIPDKTLSIREGAIVTWQSFFEKEQKGKDGKHSWGRSRIAAMEKQWGLDIDKPWHKLSQQLKNAILYGPKKLPSELTLKWNGNKGSGSWVVKEEGLVNRLLRRYEQTKSDAMKQKYSDLMSMVDCDQCHGQRLKAELLSVYVQKKSIMDLCAMTVQDCHQFFQALKLNQRQKLIAEELLKEIRGRLSFLLNVGLEYLNLNRKGPSLSGGEAQRIRLASQVGSELTGVLYVLDEPSIGLHERDHKRLLETLERLRDIGNSIIVVEHDRGTIAASDWIVDIGPGAGHLGGSVVAEGTPKALMKSKKSLTAQYLSGKKQIEIPSERRKPSTSKSKGWLKLRGAAENNLKKINFDLPLGLFNCVTGVSGAGKSTLIGQILYPLLANKLMKAQLKVGQFLKFEGHEQLDKVIHITQQPIGRTPRSNPATYTKVFDLIRDFFALLPDSRLRGYKKGRFSFNVKGGRCETCRGDGYVRVEMHFLSDVFVPCEVCKGKRFNRQTLEVTYKSLSIADVLDLSVVQARELFEHQIAIKKVLDTLIEVGLDYIKLGQAATTLSGGEAQRIKLAKELSRRDTGKTIYILDEPTTGLHFDDIAKLLKVLQTLVDKGNTVLLIEHNLDVIKTVDWIVDIGPEGGAKGGKIIAQGAPETVAKVKASHTGRFLKGLI